MSDATPTRQRKCPPPKPPRARTTSAGSSSSSETVPTDTTKTEAASIIIGALKNHIHGGGSVPLANGSDGYHGDGSRDDSSHSNLLSKQATASAPSTSTSRNSSISHSVSSHDDERETFVVVEDDLSTKTARPISVFGDQSPVPPPRSASVSDSSQDSTKRIPMLPPTRRTKSSTSSLEGIEEVPPTSPRRPTSSPPKKSRLPSHREENEQKSPESKNLQPSPPNTSPSSKKPLLPPSAPPSSVSKSPPSVHNNPVHTGSPNSAPKMGNAGSSSTLPKSSKPLLSPPALKPPKAVINRSLSADVPPTDRDSILTSSPRLDKSPCNRYLSHDGHMIAPEDKHEPVINGSYKQDSVEEEIEEGGVPILQVLNSQDIPVSPSSATSDIPDVSGIQSGTSSPVDDKSRTTPTPKGAEETDGSAVKSKRSKRQPKVTLKNDTSWINRSKQETPPSSPSERPANASPSPAKHAPYRSIPIRTQVDRTVSLSVNNDMSKPAIDRSGHYYPPAMKPHALTTSEGMTHSKSTEMMNSVQETKDEPSIDNVPARFKKTRRSNSFTDHHNTRPVSMVSTSSQSRRDNDLNSSHTIPRSLLGESLQDDSKQNKKFKQSKSSNEVKKKGFMGGIFSKHKATGIEESVKEEEETISSSDDETGGTIKRLPKNPYSSLPRKRRSMAELDSDDYVPEYHQLFEYVFVIGLKEGPGKKLTTDITYQFPPASGDINKDDALRSLHQFCYPDIEQWKPVASYKSESYSFVLTSMEGNRRFGYCRRLLPDGKGPRLPEVYCIISPLGCFDLYAKVLDLVEQRRAVSKAAVYSLLKSLIANRFPAPGRSVSVRVLPARSGDMEVITLRRPPDSRLEHVDFAELYNTLGPKLLIQVISSMLMERRVILAAGRLSTLSNCCHALLALLYPFEWQHTFIPVLPSSLIDFCGSPLPFIIGINPSMVKQLDHLEIEMEEALVVDLDKRKLVKKFGDESSILPSKVFQYLLHMLDASVIKTEYSKSVASRNKAQADQKVINTFMVMFAYFFGDYKNFLQPTDSGYIQFQKDNFMQSFNSKSSRRFLDAFLRTQMFEKFIEEREDPVKAKSVTEGVFEQKLSELKERTPDIEIFSRKKHFPWNRKKAPLPAR